MELQVKNVPVVAECMKNLIEKYNCYLCKVVEQRVELAKYTVVARVKGGLAKFSVRVQCDEASL